MATVACSAGSCPKVVKMASTSSTEVEARKLTEPMRLAERMASTGQTWAQGANGSSQCMHTVGWVATVAGWYVTEIGRQPWLVPGILRSADAVADVTPANVDITLTAYLITYAFLLTAYVAALFYLARHATESYDVNRKPDPT